MADSASDGGRRFLITAAACHYPHEPSWDRPELAEDLRRINELFTGSFGYTHLPVLGVDPTRDQLTAELRAFAMSPERTDEDYLVVYLAAHGEVRDEDGNEHLVLLSDARPADLSFTALRTADLARTLVDRTRLRRILLLLDTCESGTGGAQAAARAAVTDAAWKESRPGRGFVVVSATQPYQLAVPGVFTTGLTRAVHSLATVGNAPGDLQIGAVVDVMRGFAEPTQQVTWDAVRLTAALPAFLPNPRHDPTIRGVEQLLRATTGQRERRAEEFRRDLLPKARAALDHDTPGTWRFTGRRAALAALGEWLAATDDPGRALLVTGDPGSGKSALLGLLTALGHPEWRRSVPVDELGLRPAAVPAPGAVSAGLYVRGATTAEVLAGIAAAAGTGADTLGQLVEHLRRWPEPLTLVIDAVDEAADPRELVDRLLRPLLDHARGTRLRLLIGARAFLVPLFGPAAAILDLDTAAYADPAGLHAYVLGGLRAAFPAAAGPAVAEVAEAVAEAAGHSFLVARILTQTLARGAELPDPADRHWRDQLPTVPGDAMREDLRQRFGARTGQAEDLLLPLAYAEGQGLPWESVWAPLASALAGRTYRDEDLVWLFERAGSYVVESEFEGRSVYRLYHQALAEYLRAGRARAEVDAGFATTLTAGVRDWSTAHPYTRFHLAAHAARAGRPLERLALDPHFLLAAEPARLRRALAQLPPGPARRAAAAYHEYTARTLGDATPERLSYLLLAAHRTGSTELVEAIGRAGETLPWTPEWAHQARPWRVRRVLTHPQAAVRLAEHPGGLHTLDAEGTVRSWDLDTEVATARGAVPAEFATVRAGRYGEPDAVLAAAWEDGAVVVRELGTGEVVATTGTVLVPLPIRFGVDPVRWVRRLLRHRLRPGPIALLDTADGLYVAAAAGLDEVRHVHAWCFPHDPAAQPQHWQLPWREERVSDTVGLELVEDPRQGIVVTVADYTRYGRVQAPLPRLRFWTPLATEQRDVPVHRPEHGTIDGYTRTTAVAAGVAGGRTIGVIGTHEGGILAWDLARGALVLNRHTPGYTARSLHWSRDWPPVSALALGHLHGHPVVVCGHQHGLVQVCALDGAEQYDILRPGQSEVTAITVLETTGQLAVACADGRVHLYEPPPGWNTPRTGGSIGALVVTDSGRGRSVVAGDSTGTITAYDLADGTVRASGAARAGDPVSSLLALPGADGAVAFLTESDDRPAIWPPAQRPADAPSDGPPARSKSGPASLTLLTAATGAEYTVLVWRQGVAFHKGSATWRIGLNGGAATPVGQPPELQPLKGVHLRALTAETVCDRRLLAVSGEHMSPGVVDLGTGRFSGESFRNWLRSTSVQPTSVTVGTRQGTTVMVMGHRWGEVEGYDLPGLVRWATRPPHHRGRVTAVLLHESTGHTLLASAGVDGIVHLTRYPAGSTVTVDLGEPVTSLAMGDDTTVVAGAGSGITVLRLPRVP
ncbi:caspase family protein [Kitasatospora viridis]|uniref:Caspase domain-containing protein n=1 Tax=Kitasatospora viridis TaxID=281105 RepID=A0A561TSA8_9ACTN|nr:caspase family protein [Kitasatospora viridis]TWF89994.1 caspase domain-containing protein [Kitasatospora viridis]